MKSVLKFFTTLTIIPITIFATKLDIKPLSNSLIVYNDGIGLVHEKRALSLQKDDISIVYEGVASTIETDSVNVKLDDSVTLFSQQYRFDKLTQKKLLDAHISKLVDVRALNNANNINILDATLLSSNGGSSIIKTSKNEILTVNSNDIVFKNIPKELITKPSLVWNISTRKSLKTDMELDYLIKNINFKSDYILNIDKSNANLIGWATIDNRSGKSFKNTSLHLLAGKINKARNIQRNYKLARTVMQDSIPIASHQAHEGYHFYTIPFKVNLSNNEKTQIKFVSQKNINIKREYLSQMSNPNYLKGERTHDVIQNIILDKLTVPLPKGVVRTYSKLHDTSILLGESSINHTAKNTPISLKIGTNFDVKVKETLLTYDDNTWNITADVKYSIKNSSNENKTIKIMIPFNKNNGSKIKSDEKYTFTKGNLATFNIFFFF